MIDEKVNIARYYLYRQLAEKGYAPIRVTGQCMHPILKDGVQVRIVNKAFSSLKTGDIIVLFKGNQFLIHRIIKKTKEGLIITKGDYSCLQDSIIGESEYVGYWGRTFLGSFVALLSRIQNYCYMKYEKGSNEVFGVIFRFLIKQNMKINSLSVRINTSPLRFVNTCE